MDMEEEENDWSEGTSIEEIISIVQQRPSKFGKRPSSQPPSAVKSSIQKEKSISPETDQQSECKTWGRSYGEKNAKNEIKTISSIPGFFNKSCNVNTHERLSPGTIEKETFQGCSTYHHMNLSSRKIPCSLSSPQFKSSYSSNTLMKMDADYSKCSDGQTGHHSVPQTSYHYKLMQIDKENQKASSMQTDRLKLARKDLPLINGNAVVSVDCVDTRGNGESARESYIIHCQKIGRDSAPKCSNLGYRDTFYRNNVNMQPQMVKGDTQKTEFITDIGLLPNYSSSSKTACNALKVSPSTINPQQNRQEIPHQTKLSSQSHATSRETLSNQSLAATGTRLTVPVITLTSNNIQSNGVNCKEKVRNMSQEVNKLGSHPGGTGNFGNNIEAAKHSQNSIVQSCNMSSENSQKFQQKQDPPTPSTYQMLKEMDYIVVNNHKYLKWGLLGKGGSSKVYEVLDVESRKLKAIKVVELEGLDRVTLDSYKNEVEKLVRLQWSDCVIRLHDYEYRDTQLLLVMEKGYTDLASKLKSFQSNRSAPISPVTIKFYWQGMLLAVQAIHSEGIIHSDLKPANFVLVNDTVKVIDFGIASSIQQDMTSVLKDSKAGTFNYMSPESLMDVQTGPRVNNNTADKMYVKIGVKSDVWSLGCILYNLVYGKTPFQDLVNPLQKLVAISNPNHKIAYPPMENKQLLDVIKQCLQFDPRQRPSIHQLLQHPYLTDNTNKSPAASPKKTSQLKSVIDELAQLTPNSLTKITSMVRQMKPNASSLNTEPCGK